MAMNINQASRTKALWRVGILLVIGLGAVVLVWESRLAYLRRTLADRSLLTDVPCAAPCWQGIIPGITTPSQALEILENSSYVKQSSIRVGSRNGSGRATWYWSVPGFQGENELTWEDNIVQDISLSIAYELTLSEVIDRFGPPEALMADWCPLQQACFVVSLFYPRVGMAVGCSVDLGNPRIEPTTRIHSVSFYVPMSVEKRYAYVYRHGDSQTVEQILAHLRAITRPWRGYGGLFKVYYDSPTDLELGR
jgi:hypothetical protein